MQKRKYIGEASSPSKTSQREKSNKNEKQRSLTENSIGASSSSWSKSKRKRMRKIIAKQKYLGSADLTDTDQINDFKHSRNLSNPDSQSEQTEKFITTKNKDTIGEDLLRSNISGPNLKIPVRASSLQKAFIERLSGSRFRLLNEDLYKSSSVVSFQRFTENPGLFDEYHQGFRQQVQAWPENPVDLICHSIKNLKPTSSNLVVADFGCGEAQLAQKLMHASSKSPTSKRKKFVVHSLDLVSNGNPLITPCDMAHTPLSTASVDIGVFCLSLMGTNVADFVREAWRCLKPKGVLKIAEVRSRLEEGSNNKKSQNHDESLLDQFIDAMLRLGFQCTCKNQSNVMFILLDFCKMDQQPDPHITIHLKPCIYKRR